MYYVKMGLRICRFKYVILNKKKKKKHYIMNTLTMEIQKYVFMITC